MNQVDRRRQVEDLFQAAADIPVAERRAFLDQACDGDESIRAHVERLLVHWDAAEECFLSALPIGELAEGRRLPDQVGRYRILRQIGEGGMGIVFEAEQDQPRRRVALKIVRTALWSESLRRRFEREVEILGQLKHPGIAQIYEAGTHDDGGGPVPYFAMEYLAGRTLTEFASSQRLGLRERLRLGAEICDAVQHAHEKGVVHRDLKPANILVEQSGVALPQPKILDFGVARATHRDLQQVTMHTEPGQVIGTLSYMSPEQVTGRPDEIDARSDVYSLGVILFELLADRPPYQLNGRSIPEAGSVIREQEPTRLGAVDPALRGDVETIVGKALEKEKSRRYQSAAELAADIRRFLHDEPIVARPMSRAYQIRKFAKRNKAFVSGVVAVFATLILGIVGTSIALVRATRAEQFALARSEESRRSAAKATAVRDFLQEMLSSVDPAKSRGQEATIRQALDEASARIDAGALADQPELEGELRSTIGMTYYAIGRYDEAENHLRAALHTRKRLHSKAHPDLATSLDQLSGVILAKGNHLEAEALLRECLAVIQSLHGPRHFEVASAKQALGAVLRAQGRYAAAEPMYVEALAIRRELFGDEHLDVAQSLNSLALLRQNKSDYEGAEKYFREALAIRRKLLGDPHPVVADALNNLANLLHLREKSAEAEHLLVEGLEMRRKLLGPDHPQLAQSLNNLAVFYHDQDELGKAEPLYRQALVIWRETLPSGHPDIGNAAAGLGVTLTGLEHYAEAEPPLREALDIRTATLPEGHPGRFTVMSCLGAALAGQGRFDEAERLVLEGYLGIKDSPTVPARSKRMARKRLVRLYESWGKPEEAARWNTDVIDAQ